MPSFKSRVFPGRAARPSPFLNRSHNSSGDRNSMGGWARPAQVTLNICPLRKKLKHYNGLRRP